MSVFSPSSPEEELIETCKRLQEQQGYSANEIILALSRVLNCYAEYVATEDEIYA